MARIKYMGSSHVHRLLKGDNFGGRLATPLPQEVRFDRSNDWIVDSNEVGLSPEAVSILVTDPDFRDVTGEEKLPLNKHQKIFLAMKEGDETPPADPPSTATATAAAAAAESTEDTDTAEAPDESSDSEAPTRSRRQR